MSIKSIMPIILLAAFLLAGCSASSEPRLIAAFPLGEWEPHPQPPQPPVPPAHPQPPQAFVYHARLVLETWRPSRTASRAEALAHQYGGYLVSTNAFYTDGSEHLSVVLVVPVYNFHLLYGDLHDLGIVVGEQVWGEWREYGPGGAANYSQITLDLAPRRIGISLPAIFPEGWSPLRTFTSALRISGTIFRFVVDAAIWLLVIVAPFVLIVLGLRLVIRRLGS